MSTRNGLFLFEVVLDKLSAFVEGQLFIKADFSDIFSLDLQDPKSFHVAIPDPLPLPPEKPGKKKPKKPKKPKKGKEPPPPPEPIILFGQSVLFTSSPEILYQNMKEFPMQISMWSKESSPVFMGSCNVTWDSSFLKYLEQLFLCNPQPVPVVKDEYNILEERDAKLVAKATMQVKLRYLTEQIYSSFRTLTEEPVQNKFFYTGMNNKQKSYMCTLRTTDEEFKENWAKVKAKFITDKGADSFGTKSVFADYKNAPGAKIPFTETKDSCCTGNRNKVLNTKYPAPDKVPDIDYICDYVRKVINSCNDNMRMLTPRNTIRRKVYASDLDKLCYCKQTGWPDTDLADKFRKETQGGPCPVCVQDYEGTPRPKQRVLDIANIRGPCGRPDCRIARDMRVYLEKLVEEDNKEIKLQDIIGPCGSKECTLVDRIKQFLRHEGRFERGKSEKGLPTQCNCVDQLQNSLIRTGSCDSICSHDCESSSDYCGGKVCPYKSSYEDDDSDKPGKAKGGIQNTYFVYYFTVELTNPTSVSGTTRSSSKPSLTSKHSEPEMRSFCAPDCPGGLSEAEKKCSKKSCNIPIIESNSKKKNLKKASTCINLKCPLKTDEGEQTPSPADSNIELRFDEIRNPCCVKSCTIANRVKDIILAGLKKKEQKKSCLSKDPCYCDCECNLELMSPTTYCGVCGGYESLGKDAADLPDCLRPHPCPIYHNLYNKVQIPVKSFKPDKDQSDSASMKATKPTSKVKSVASDTSNATRLAPKKSVKSKPSVSKKIDKEKKDKKEKKKKDKDEPGKKTGASAGKFHRECFQNLEFVPKNMGWLWTAEDIPGMKPRPKWKPGAALKVLVQRYRANREGVDVIMKKKRALLNKRKKIEMKPTLVVTKKDGEYTVQMEVLKKYSKERLRYQYPYDEKPPLIYTIGKTEDVKAKLQKQRDRKERRESRRKSRMLQSTFRDKCQEICVKAFNQGIGVSSVNPNNPECPCSIKQVEVPTPVIDSCSCSMSGSLETSDTDGDEWTIEFTPPVAIWDAKAKHPPVLVEKDVQYNYLDYKVKLFDKQGNPIPRYFKNQVGETLCSDLGGFFGLDGTWQEINKDGFIGADGRWAPINFTGPDGEWVSAEDGKFSDAHGRSYVIGIDGYVDCHNKWQSYHRKTEPGGQSASAASPKGGKEPAKVKELRAGAHKSHPLCKLNTLSRPERSRDRKQLVEKSVSTSPDKQNQKKRGVFTATAPKKQPSKGAMKDKKTTSRRKSTTVMNVSVREPIFRGPVDDSLACLIEDPMECRPTTMTSRAVNTTNTTNTRCRNNFPHTSKNIDQIMNEIYP